MSAEAAIAQDAAAATKKGVSSSPDNPNQLKNTAFVMIKPHANTSLVQHYVHSNLHDEIPGLRIQLECNIPGERIERRKLLENHIGSVATNATFMDVKDVKVPAAKFEKAFSENYAKVLKEGRVVTAIAALSKFQCDAEQLETAWYDAESRKRVHKLTSGLYMGLVKIEKKSLYVVNGHYMAMKEKYTGGDSSVHCFVVDFEESVMTWKGFLEKIVGNTEDPSEALEGSMRHEIFKRYQEFDIFSEPNKSDNSIHASASPLVALSERCNWLRREISEDEFGKALLKRGIPETVIKSWLDNPIVTLPPKDAKNGSHIGGSIFSHVDGMDSTDCMNHLVAVYDYELFRPTAESSQCGCTIL